MIKENIYVAINRNDEIQWVQGSSKKTRYFKTDRYLKGAVEYHNKYHPDDIWKVRKCVILEDEPTISKMEQVEDEPSSSEIPNNCEVKNYCDDCLYTDTCDSKEFFYACTSKPTISKMEQVDKDINVRSKDKPQTNADQRAQRIESVETMSCQECKRWIYDDRWGWFCPLKSQDECKYEPKDEPQTERSE